MLNNLDLEDKTYEDLLAEAMLEIPIYSQEWTNFLPSDPGIMMLENFTSFAVLQQNHINQITPAIEQKLLALLGFKAAKGRCARLTLAAQNQNTELEILANRKFYLGDLCFETNRSFLLKPCHVTGVYGNRDGKWFDYSYLKDREVNVAAEIFGQNPKSGDSLWLLSDSLPDENEEVIFDFCAESAKNRNPFEKKGDNTFAQVIWECFTEDGFVQMNVRDDTDSFCVSNQIRFRLPGKKAAPCPQAPEKDAYVIRGTLVQAQYDISPRLFAVNGFLFEVWQKETKAICRTFNHTGNLVLQDRLVKEEYLMVFCREQKGGSYRRYDRANAFSKKGRYYEFTAEKGGTYRINFNKEKYGFGPMRQKNVVKVVAYNEQMMRKFDLGVVSGTDNQTIMLPEGHVVADTFCIIAEREQKDGDRIYDFVRPGKTGEGYFCYRLYENEGKIEIVDAGAYVGAHLYIGMFVVTAGPAGNIREGNILQGEDCGNVTFYNPRPGTGGCFREDLDAVKKNFLADLNRPYTAVTAGDYEYLVKNTPGLCIRKVKAFLDEEKNLVRIAVMPDTEEKFPVLSDHYKQEIEKQLNDRRLLATRIEIVGAVYTPVDVIGTIYVKRNYDNSLSVIQEEIRQAVDCVYSDRQFGESIRFDQVFARLEALECVEFVYDISLHPQNPVLAKPVDADIVPVKNCLCYPGDIQIDLITYRM